MTKATWPRSQWAPGGEGIEMHARGDFDLARSRDWRTRNASDEIRIATSARELSVISITVKLSFLCEEVGAHYLEDESRPVRLLLIR